MIKNVVIERTSLGLEDHGIFTAMIYLSGDSWGIGFGGYALDQWEEAEKRRVGVAYGAEFIKAVLKTLGVETWEQLPKTPCRVDLTNEHSGPAVRIGHYIQNVWFDPKALAEKFTTPKT